MLKRGFKKVFRNAILYLSTGKLIFKNTSKTILIYSNLNLLGLNFKNYKNLTDFYPTYSTIVFDTVVCQFDLRTSISLEKF